MVNKKIDKGTKRQRHLYLGHTYLLYILLPVVLTARCTIKHADYITKGNTRSEGSGPRKAKKWQIYEPSVMGKLSVLK